MQQPPQFTKSITEIVHPKLNNGLFSTIGQLQTYHQNLCTYVKIEMELDRLSNEQKLDLLKEVVQIAKTLKNYKHEYEQAKNRTNSKQQGSDQSTSGSTKEIRGGNGSLRENQLQEVASELTTYSRTIRSGRYYEPEEESENGGSIS